MTLVTDLFATYRGLYHPQAHPKYPWWHRESNGINIRWVRADGTWQVQVNQNTMGDITVQRLDLGEMDEETLRLRTDRSFYPFVGNIPIHAKGALIERVSLKMDQSGSDFFSEWFVPQKPEDLPAYVDKMILRLERECPMPRPPIWAGQCWCLPDVFGGKPFFLTDRAGENKSWVGALLYGPTKYGRDVPWLHPDLFSEIVP